MRTFVKINDHKGYVDMPMQDGEPNPYAVQYGNNPRLWRLDLEVTESADLEVGQTVTVVFRRGKIEILEES